jgi:carbamoyltransferase
MAFLGLHIGLHDCNISAYKNGKTYYSKYERYSGIKHGQGSFEWIENTLKKWNIEWSEIEEICIQEKESSTFTANMFNEMDNMGMKSETATFAGPSNMLHDYIQSEFHGAIEVRDQGKIFIGGSTQLQQTSVVPNLITEGLKVLKSVIDKNIKITEVDHHTLHAYSTLSKNKQAVIDGKGTGNTYGVVGDKVLTIGSDGFPMGSFLTRIGMKMGLSTGNDILDSLDVPGKIMGLQSYGNSYYIDDRPVNILNSIFEYEGNATHNNSEWLNLVSSVHDKCFEYIKGHFDTQFNHTKDPINYTGGVALNVVWNTELKKHYNIDIPPYCNDEGISIGALAYLGEKHNFEVSLNLPFCQDDELPWDEVCSHTIRTTAESLAKGQIVGWYQGHGEIGPRALGNRSVLMNPTLSDGKNKINSIKKREPWRPFGASVKQDKSKDWFDIEDSPYMLYNAQVKNDGIPTVTHIDNTCRPNTVTPEMNPAYYELLDEFEKLTGVPVLLNTSLNRMGEPIAGTRDQAIKLFNETQIDKMVIGSKTWAR